jgi:hypothetical protein
MHDPVHACGDTGEGDPLSWTYNFVSFPEPGGDHLT